MTLNVAAADAYIEALLREPEEKADPKRTFVMKDVRVFVNTILHGLDLMKQGRHSGRHEARGNGKRTYPYDINT